MDKERARGVTDKAKGPAKETGGKPSNDKEAEDRRQNGEAADGLEEAERAAERAREERERSQF